jgi:cytoplasmic iron level regulating protein YaaA (DUF328/UPF0246 family)
VLILLPPSEGKSVPRRGRPLALDTLSFPALTEPRQATLAAVGELCSGDPTVAMEVLGIGPTQAELVERNAGLLDAPAARADRIYTGVLYDNLGLRTLDGPARRRAARWLAVQSALFGLVRPGDHIPSYRLSGDVTLPGLGKVAAHWRTVLDPVLREAVGDGLLVDLRSGTYAAFWRPSADLAAQVATVRVLQQVGTQRTVVSHFNKATKGRIVRDLLIHGDAPRTPAALADLLGALGWKVESHAPSRSGQVLDVIVDEL